MKLFPLKKYIRDSFANANIQNKIMFSFILIIFIMSISIGGLSYILYSREVINKTIDQSQETIKQLSINIEHTILLIKNNISFLAYNPQVQSLLNEEIETSSNTLLQSHYRSMSKLMVLSYNSSIDELEIYGENGIDYYISSHERYKEKEAYTSLLENAKEAHGKTLILFDPIYNKEVQIVKEINDLVNLSELGILRASLKESIIENLVREIDLATEAKIVIRDDQGNVIVGDTDFFDDSSRPYFDYINGCFKYKKSGEVYYVVYETSDETKWKTIGVLSNTILRREVISLRNKTIIITFIMFLVCIIFSKILSQIIVNPIIDMTQAMDVFSKGDFDIRLSPTSEDEIGQLSTRFNVMVEQIDMLIKKVYEAEILKKESELKAIQSKINPHFLYNTLDTINWLAKKEGIDSICKIVNSIASLMRISIDSNTQYITLKEEIEFVEAYLSIQKIRYDDKILFYIDIDHSLLNHSIPKLLLQPLVENSIIHGIENIPGIGYISIKCYKKNSFLILSVEDSGKGFDIQEYREMLLPINANRHDSNKHTHMGLNMLDARIKNIYGDEYGIDIDSEVGKGTLIKISLPFIEMV